ncbi:MAG TPA: hypothetical protein VEW25_13605, partial [Allosphingosinicella sp.]|nr:hypothetical protein [Allosphingosinicella sp.]
MEEDLQRLRRIWNQQSVPVIMRNGKDRPRMRLPYDVNNRGWIENGRRTSVTWHRDKKHWEVPKTWFNDLVQRTLAKFG